MSTFQTPFEHHVLGPAGPGAPKLAPRAAIYFFLVAAATTLAAAPPISHLKAGTSGWTTFAILIPAVMLLPPEFVALVAVIHHIPEWLKTRATWYIAIFNICNFTLA